MKTEPMHNRASILVVDDDVMMRTILTEMLLNEGVEVIEAENGLEAMEMLEDTYPDMIIMDALMPEMDGFKTSQALRKLPQHAHTPLLMMTGLDDSESIDRAYECGVTDFIAKPINHSLFTQRIRYMLRNGDVTKSLFLSQNRLAEAQRVAKIGYWEWDASSKKIIWSPHAAELLQLDLTADLGVEALLERVHGEDLDKVRHWFHYAVSAQPIDTIIHKAFLPNGEQRYLHHQVNLNKNERGEVLSIYGIVQDVTTMQEAQAQINTLAHYDELTGLPKRKLFEEALQDKMDLCQRFSRLGAVLYIEVTNLNAIVDSFAYESAERLLKQWTDDLSQLLDGLAGCISFGEGSHSQEDVQLSRIASNQFTVLIADISRFEDAAIVAKKIKQLEKTLYPLDDAQTVFTTAIGISIFPADATTVDEAIRNSHLAMNHASQNGALDYNFFDDKMDHQAMERVRIESHLRHAVERGELYLMFQPQINVVTHELEGFEALLRWESSELGFVPPDKFIPIAEQSGLIIEIGDWVFKQACLFAKSCLTKRLDIPRIAVNFSVRQFEQTDFIGKLISTINVIGIPANMIEIEVTESLLMEIAEQSQSLNMLRALRSYGFSIAIDDFGTGYSSLAYLKQLPIDHLKIDKTFVDEICHAEQDAAIVNAIISMAKKMHLNVTAEGVETIEQYSMLSEFGTDVVQGYLFSKPLMMDDIDSYLQSLYNNNDRLFRAL